MDLIEQLRAWSYGRQRLGASARGVGEALRAVVAVYATHPTSPLALAARIRGFTPATYRRIDSDRSGLRLPAMRRTVFLVPRKDAANVFTAVRASPAHARRPLRRYGVSDRVYERLTKRILDSARRPTSAQDLRAAAGIKGQQLGAVLRALRYEGRLLTVPGHGLMMGAHGYVATDAWAPEGLDGGDQAEALSWLARAYLRGYGPARVEDFAWWAGVTERRAAEAIRGHTTVEVDPGMLLLSRDEAAFGRVKAMRGTLDLLPKWDAYTMGHAPDGRRRFVHPDVQKLVYTPIGPGLAGDGNPVILLDGQAAGTWTYSLKDGAAVQPFDSLGPRIRRLIDEQLEAVADMLAG